MTKTQPVWVWFCQQRAVREIFGATVLVIRTISSLSLNPMHLFCRVWVRTKISNHPKRSHFRQLLWIASQARSKKQPRIQWWARWTIQRRLKSQKPVKQRLKVMINHLPVQCCFYTRRSWVLMASKRARITLSYSSSTLWTTKCSKMKVLMIGRSPR